MPAEQGWSGGQGRQADGSTFAEPRRIASADQAEAEIDVMDWLGGRQSAIVLEEVVGLGHYGKTLIVLSSEDVGRGMSRDEDDDEEQVVKS